MQIGPFDIDIQTDKFDFFVREYRTYPTAPLSIKILPFPAHSPTHIRLTHSSNGVYRFHPDAAVPTLQQALAVEGVKHNTSLIMHAAGLQYNDRGFFVFGKSGTGKSTLSQKLLSYFTVGNDDNNLLIFPSTDNQHFSFVSLPFYNQEKHQPTPIQKSIPLQIACLLQKEFNNSSSITKLDDKDAIWRFLIDGQIQAPLLEPSLFPQYNTMVSEFVEKTDFFLLKHNLNDSAEFLHNVIVGAMNE